MKLTIYTVDLGTAYVTTNAKSLDDYLDELNYFPKSFIKARNGAGDTVLVNVRNISAIEATKE